MSGAKIGLGSRLGPSLEGLNPLWPKEGIRFSWTGFAENYDKKNIEKVMEK